MSDDQANAQVNLLVDFANTFEEGGDELIGTPAELAGWLADHGLLATGATVTKAQLTLAHELRTGFRAAMAAHHDRSTGEIPGLDAAAARLRLTMTFDGPKPRLAATGSPVEQALGGLLIAAHTAAATGTWQRLKLCAAATCAEAFYDVSKNRSRTWCSMEVCGNRQKTRSYRRRQATPEPAANR
ncbi:MAG: CGNR zinc finger domain-containing protein [Sporichthyaceae bacterium]|nr:CGNR zinc finger domain-containing protein [Sporichthyaceae bacterium]